MRKFLVLAFLFLVSIANAQTTYSNITKFDKNGELIYDIRQNTTITQTKIGDTIGSITIQSNGVSPYTYYYLDIDGFTATYEGDYRHLVSVGGFWGYTAQYYLFSEEEMLRVVKKLEGIKSDTELFILYSEEVKNKPSVIFEYLSNERTYFQTHMKLARFKYTDATMVYSTDSVWPN